MTDGLGVLSWLSPNSGTVTSITAGTGLSGGTITGTGTISLPVTGVNAGSYTRANITVDAYGRITTASPGSSLDLASDVTGTLPIASGGTGGTTQATAQQALGLGSLATKNAVTSSEITDGTIVDADIASNAGIASTKILFGNDSISGDAVHGGTISSLTSTGITDLAASTTMTLTSSGNVGIGTASPTDKLSVNGGISTQNLITSGYGIPLKVHKYWDGDNYGGGPAASGTEQSAIARFSKEDNWGPAGLDLGSYWWGMGFWIQTSIASDLAINKPLFLNPKGGGVRVGSGNNSPFWGPINTFDVAGNMVVSSNWTNVTAPSNGLLVEGQVGIGTASPNYKLEVNGSIAGVGAYNQLSDGRYKKDIADITDSLAKVLAIRGVTYKWIDDDHYGNAQQIGVIAQEIEKIVPEAVATGSDGVKRVRYTDLVPLLIEALKHEHRTRDAESAAKDTEIRLLKAESAQLRKAFCEQFPKLALCLQQGQ